MTDYHIDWVNGNDANTGLSWAQAWKTFLPIAKKTVTVVTGDVVKLAKSPTTEVVDPLTFPVKLSGQHNTYTTLNGWRTVRFNVSSSIYDNFRAVPDMDTGWTGSILVPSVLGDGLSSAVSEARWLRYSTNVAAINLTLKTAYTTLASTVDLSGFSRLEMPVHFTFDGAYDDAAIPTMTIRFCSDTLGDTPLLTLTITSRTQSNGLFVYEGALPAGINSVSLTVETASSPGYFHFKSPVATRAYSDANYVGYLSVARIGDHESAAWHFIDHFHTNSVGITYMMTGPASEFNTSKALRFRKTVGWGGYLGAGISPWPSNGMDFMSSSNITNANRAFYAPFHMPNTAGQPTFSIIGGWNTTTNAVDGKTYIRHDTWPLKTYTMCYSPIFALYDGAIPTLIQNLVCVSSGSQVMTYYNHSQTITFDNCEIYTRRYDNGTWHRSSWGGRSNASSISPSLVFNNCKGNLVVADAFGSAFHIPKTTLHNCVLSLWNRVTTSLGMSTGFMRALVKLTGTCSVYCAGGGPSQATDITSSRTFSTASMYLFPIDPDSTTETLYIYGGGNMLVGICSTTPLNTYTMLPLVLENTYLEFIDYAAIVFAENSWATYGPASIVLPSVSMSLAFPYRDAQTTGGEANEYAFSLFCNMDSASPPIDIRNVTVTGAAVYASTSNVTALLHDNLGVMSLTNVDITASGRWVMLRGLASAATNINSVTIIDDVVFSSVSNLVSLNLFGENIRGPVYVKGWSATYALGCALVGAFTDLAGVLHLKNCSITYTNGASFFPSLLTSLSRGSVQIAHEYTLAGRGIVLEDTPANLSNLDTVYYTSQSDMDQRNNFPLTIIDNGAPSHVVYTECAKWSKDFTTAMSSPHSWKSVIMSLVRFATANMLPLATVPVTLVGDVTVSLHLRRTATTNNNIALVVYPNGATGSVATDFKPVFAYHTAGAGEWQQVSISFTSQRNTQIDIYVAHHGAVGAEANFDNLKVVEL